MFAMKQGTPCMQIILFQGSAVVFANVCWLLVGEVPPQCCALTWKPWLMVLKPTPSHVPPLDKKLAWLWRSPSLPHVWDQRTNNSFLSQGKKLFWLHLLNEEMKLHTCSVSWTLGNLWQKDRHIFLRIWYCLREPDISFSSVSRALAHVGNCALFPTFSIQFQFLPSWRQ